MSTIRDIAREAINRYPSQAEPIVAALEEREIGMRATIVQGGRELGAPESRINSILDAAGLGMTARHRSSNGAVSSDDSTKNERIADLQRRMEALEQVAAEARNRGLIR